MSEEPAFAGADRQAEMIRAKEISPRELVELYLERISRLDPQLNAFRVVLADQALEEAKKIGRRKPSEDRPLHGIPVAIKDSEDVAGELTTHGTGAVDMPAAEDSEMVRLLRDAGAIIIGKTHLPELAICGFTESATWGVTRNPWNPERTPGGSSGGSASAVAAGMVPLASASDGAGSIRIPAASCGVFGIKPQRDRVSVAPDPEHWYGLSVKGCEARTVADSALYLDVTSGTSPNAGAPPPPDKPFREYAKTAPGKLRIAWSVQPIRLIAPATIDETAIGAVHETAELLGGLGHDVSEQDPDWGLVGNNVTPRYLRGILHDFEHLPHPERTERRTQRFARMGRLMPERQLERARRAEAADAQRLFRIFDDHDVLLMPVMGGTALPVRRWEGRGALWTMMGMSRFYPFCAAWNHLGNPATSVPAGFSSEGMPLAVQLVGRPSDEGTLLSLAAQLEAERPWADAKPPIS